MLICNTWDGNVLQLAVVLSYNQLNAEKGTKDLIQVFASEPPRVPRNRGTGGTFSQSVNQTLAQCAEEQ